MLQKQPRLRLELITPKHLILEKVKNGTFSSQKAKWIKASFNIINLQRQMAIQPHSGEDLSFENQTSVHTCLSYRTLRLKITVDRRISYKDEACKFMIEGLKALSERESSMNYGRGSKNAHWL